MSYLLATQQCQTSYLSVKMGYLLSYGVLMDVKHSIKMELSYKVLVHGRYFINVHFFLSTPSLIILFISLHTFLLLFLCLYHWIMSIFFLAFVFCFFVFPQPHCPPSPPVLAFSGVGGGDGLLNLSITQPLADLDLTFIKLSLKYKMFSFTNKDMEKL